MSELPLPDEPSGAEPPIDSATETNVESLVDQMADSAASLRSQVGADAPPAPEAAHIAEIDALETEPAAAIDQQLNQAEALLQTTQRELDAVAESLDEIAAAAPEAPAAAPPPPAADSLGPDTNDPPSATPSAEAGPSAHASVDAELRAKHSPDPPSAPAAMGLRCAGAVVGVLERIDRPFARLSYAVRLMLGWCAIATIIVSVLLIAYSFVDDA